MLTNNIILEESLALPLAIYPYSNKSKIIHWLSKDFGHISTFLSGMKNSKNFIFKEFGYFSTSYLTFEKNKNLNLFQIKDCEIKSLRNDFKYNWKAMQIASYFTYFFYKISPENAVDINLFNFYEKLLDLSLKYSNNPLFIIWCELSLLKDQGNLPEIRKCVLSGNKNPTRFAASQGGSVCLDFVQKNEIYSFPFNKEEQLIIEYLIQSDDFEKINSIEISNSQLMNIDRIISRFMEYTYHLNPKHRDAATTYE